MSNGSELKSPGARALRAAGFYPLPRWWVTKEQLDLVEYMARQNEAEVNRIRAEAHEKDQNQWRKKREIDLAWKTMRAGREST